MQRYINRNVGPPFTEFGFKKLFGEEANKELLIDFLNQLLVAKIGLITYLTYLGHTAKITPKRTRIGSFPILISSMIIRLLLINLLLSSGYATQAQDHLVPTENYYSSYSFQHTYYSFVRDKLLADLDDELVAQAVVLPSFEPEYVICIQKDKKAYLLVFRTLSRSIWSVHNKGEKAVEDLKLSESKRSISSELGQQLQKLYFEAVCQTRYPKRKYTTGPNGKPYEELRIGADGTTYSFTAFQEGHGNRTGKIWSPAEGSPMDSLVILTDQLAAFAKGNEVEADLLNRAAALYKQIAIE